MLDDKYYILVNDEIIRATDRDEWAKSLEATRVVKQTKIGKVLISTVFLGIDHRFDSGPPILFETMVFGGRQNEYCKRYCTIKSARLGHDKMVKMVQSDSWWHWFMKGLLWVTSQK